MSIQAGRRTQKIGRRLYVAVGGTDSPTAGTRDNPFATIAYASTHVTPGTTVFVAPGTYGNVYMMTSGGGGTAQDPVIYMSTERWGAKIVSASTDAGWYFGNQTTAGPSFIRVVGFEVTAPASRYGFLVDGSSISIENCHVYNVNNNVAQAGGGIDLEGFWGGLYQGTDNAAHSNVVHNIGRSDSDQCHPIYVASPNSYVTNNLVYNTGGWGIHCYHAPNGSRIVNNTVFDCPQRGGIIWGDGPEVQTVDGYTANNIVRNCGVGISETNNVFGVEYRNNLFYQNVQDDSIGPNAEEFDHKYGDPEMVNFQLDGSGDYHLAPGSPWTNQGYALHAPPTDLDGHGRSQPYGIGAYT